MSRHRRLRVSEVIVETADARTVVLEVPGEDADRFRAQAGQFLTVHIPLPTGSVARCYSLSSAPDEPLAVTVKRAGPGSSWVVDTAAVGQEWDVLPPAGRFTPRSPDTDLLLIGAGSGITPLMSILRWVLASGSAAVTLVYANRGLPDVIFAAQLEQMQAAHPDRVQVLHWLESERGLPDPEALRGLLEPWAARDTFLCGPEPFMAATEKALAMIPAAGRLHVERFVSLDEDPFQDAQASAVDEVAGDIGPSSAVEVELDGVVHQLDWPGQTPLLTVMEAAGLDVPFSCRSGNCGACTVLLERGEVHMPVNDVLEKDDLADGYILACQAVPRAPDCRVTFDR